MLALTWKQPFGSAMLIGKLETRTWKTNYRGKVLICVGKQEHATPLATAGEENYNRIFECLNARQEILNRLLINPPADTLPLRGYAIAVGTLTDCRPMVPEDSVKAFVLYHPGLYIHQYQNVQPIKPIPFSGAQRWKKVDQQLIETIEYL